MSLRDHGFTRRQLRQGGGRGTGEDHVDAMFGSTELTVYLTPNTRPKGYESLKAHLEAQGCEIVVTADTPPELSRYEAVRITYEKADPIPNPLLKRAHKWAHQRNYLHSFFKPMYR